MILPWALIGRIGVALAAGAAVLWLRGARRARVNAATDLVLSLLIGAALGGRLLVVALDAVLLGALPDPRSLLALGPGLSAPGALVGATVAGWRRRPLSVEAWQDTAVVTAGGLAAFSASHLPAIPVANGVRIIGLGATAVWLARSDSERWHAGLRLLTALAGVHLLAGAVTPSLATIDTDINVVLTCVVLVAGVLSHPRVAPATRRMAGVVGAVLGSLVLAVILSAEAGPPPTVVDPAATASLEGAIMAGGGSADVPRWGADQLAVLVADTDLPIVVNLWASWCPPCHAEAATVDRAAQALQGRAVVIGVLVDDEVADGQVFADRYGLSFPTVANAGLSGHLGMVGLPTTVILDADGRIVERVVGGLAQGTLASAIGRAEG